MFFDQMGKEGSSGLLDLILRRIPLSLQRHARLYAQGIGDSRQCKGPGFPHHLRPGQYPRLTVLFSLYAEVFLKPFQFLYYRYYIFLLCTGQKMVRHVGRISE